MTPELDARFVLSARPMSIVLHEVSVLFASPKLEFVVPISFTSIVVTWKNGFP